MKMPKLLIFLSGYLVSLAAFAANPPAPLQTLGLARAVLEKGLTKVDLGTYQGTLLLQAMSELALTSGDKALLERTNGLFKKFATKEIKGRGSFISYEAGGSGAAYLIFKGAADGLQPQVNEAAQRMFDTQKRSGEGILVPGWTAAGKDQVFIDMAFAVTPYLLYVGLSEHRPEYVDLAAKETLDLFRILRDSKTGLLHQGRGFQGLNVVSQDCWSRGNGWGAIALAALVRDLPADHPRKAEIQALARDYFSEVVKYQNKEGLWHQEMTDSSTYVETSGSGLLLYGLGVMLETGQLDKKYEKNFVSGLAGLTSYIAQDGSVSHTCGGCLCPKDGSKAAYKERLWVYNDPHSFGPLVLAYAEAARLGIKEVVPSLKPGCYAAPIDAPGKPRTYVRYESDRAQNISWENDRMAFRVYGPVVKDKVGSGIDIWAKSVDFPIVEKWYRLAAAGYPYHLDRGEGCDFYDVGWSRGCGGLAVWKDGKPYVSQTYATHTIDANNPDELKFSLSFAPWDAAGVQVSEKKTVRMLMGTNFFQVESIISSADGKELTIALGLATFGHASLTQNSEKGLLSSWEKITPAHGFLGTAIFIDPSQFAGFAKSGSEEFVLVHVKPGEPFRYYIGAGWEGNYRFGDPQAWKTLVERDAGWESLNLFYAKK